jgi:hypothetical protein
MIQEDQVFIVDVVVTDLMWKIVVSNVISRLVNVVTKLSAIAKICKYRGLHEGHHFILMAMEVHGTLGRDMDRFIKECVHIFSTIDDQEVIYPFLFAFKFSSSMLILFFNVL